MKQYEELQGIKDTSIHGGMGLSHRWPGEFRPNSEKAIEWLGKAVALGSTRGCYELVAVHYMGLDGVLEEDAEAAFCTFKRAAEQDHTSALFMMADCLV
jgi:TPR repeat protein